MRFAHIADVHLGKKTDAGTFWEEESQREIYDGFSAFVDHIEINPVEFIFITGDLFDHVPDRDDLIYVDNLLARLEETYIIYVTGEHDHLKRSADIWKYKFVSNMFILNLDEFNNNKRCENVAVRTSYVEEIVDCVYFEKYNLDIYGICQYSAINSRNDYDTVYVHDLNRISILLGHGGGKKIAPYDPENMRGKKFSYIGMGHLHTYTEYTDQKIYYPGSLEPLSPEEEGQHGYIRGYIDGLISDIKFVPISQRQYKNIEIHADCEMTNKQISDNIIDICKRNKRYIYSFEIVRDEDCITDFDVSPLRKKYRISDVKGEKCYKGRIIKLKQSNSDNIFGQTLERIEKAKKEQAYKSIIKYATKMSEKLWGQDGIEIGFEIADKEAALKAHEEVCVELSEEMANLMRGLDKCNAEKERLNNCFKEYPDMTGEINVARAKLSEVERELDGIKFEDAQVDEIYNRGRIGFVLHMNFPVVFVIVVLLLGNIVPMLMSRYDVWLKPLIKIFIFLLIYSVVAYIIYNRTKKLRNKFLGTKIPSESHAKNNIIIDEILERQESLVNELSELSNRQNKYKGIHNQIREVQDKKEKLINKINVITQIIN